MVEWMMRVRFRARDVRRNEASAVGTRQKPPLDVTLFFILFYFLRR